MVLVSAVGCAPKASPDPSTETSAAVSQSAEQSVATETSETKTLKFMLSNAYYTAPYCAAYNPSAQAKAEELGVQLTILDANGNQQTALEHANQAIAEGYDGFLYLGADVDGALPIIEALNESGIAWMGLNTYDGTKIGEVGMKYFFGPDSKSHGITMANTLMELFPDGAKVVAIEGTAGHNQTIKFNEAFGELLDPAKYVFLDKQDCNFQAELAMTKMTDMLTAYGLASKGGQIDCIISHDGGMLTGIISALEGANYQPGDVKIVACGSNRVVYDALKSGWLSATSTQDPVAEGAQAVDILYNIVTNPGSVEPGWIKLDTPVAYPETADNFNWFG
jgi:ABC-type sugar transport system substrate-binding protein